MSLGPEASPGFQLWRVTHRWQRTIVAALRPFELTHVQFVLLVSTWWLGTQAEGPPTQRRIAEHAGTDPMMTSQVLRALERRGLVIRGHDPDDARARRVSCTPPGVALAERTVAVVETADRAFFSAGDPDALLRALARLA